ncbi:MAG: SDR family oxidoreductase [Rhodospirillaceae bacterium]|jgi:NAD(P)-dependent dehydrogenase (short-subunit alcohol dehydrogenase family)|nr:SDR family oxidoreductase [Rhodospirillaceae bacterium]MBT5938756.1 SDR family oxidoreductase [Rhodospirillaceae bacterium]MBT7268404.1 SDR family oxidoreductase [Rhodospirillaceae bacterium]
MGRLDGRTAVVTGAAHGDRAALGVVYAKALAAEGAKVVVADVKDTSDVAAEIIADGGDALALSVDVTDEAQVNELMAKTVDHFGSLEVLINNAAIGSNIPQIPVTEMSVEDWDALMAVNVRGSFLCVKAAVPQMQKKKYGKIINIGSTTMMTGLTHRLHYTSAKGAILAMTRSLAAELGGDGIRVNTAAYGLVTSQLNDEQFASDPAFEAKVLGARALPVHYRAEDLGPTIVYMAAADSDHMTGQCMVINAGEYFY